MNSKYVKNLAHLKNIHQRLKLFSFNFIDYLLYILYVIVRVGIST